MSNKRRMIKEHLCGRVDGFMAKTHAILSLMLLLICMLVPLDIFQGVFGVLRDDLGLFFVCLIAMLGGAGIPDLDNFMSKAMVNLGMLGRMLSVFMQSTSAMVWNVYHMKGDRPPQSQHRYLWHAPSIAIGIIALFYFGLEEGDYTLLGAIRGAISLGEVEYFVKTNAVLLLLALLLIMASVVGSDFLISIISRIKKPPKYVKALLPILTVLYILFAPYTKLRMVGIFFGLGYLFHLIEDFFADSGIPLLWPIPSIWVKKVWARYRFPITVETGSTSNSVVDIIAFVTTLVLIMIHISIALGVRG